jgi:methylated-DNA-protein-cysteine methyltransferase-like protein
MTVVYCTSTTGFNICFIPSREFASKALTLPFASSRNVFRFVFPAIREALPTELEDTRAPPNFCIIFLALFHSFRASIVFITCPYTPLDALARKMLPVWVPAFCCTVFSLCLIASSAFNRQRIKHPCRRFVVALEQGPHNLVGCSENIEPWKGYVKKMSWDPVYRLVKQIPRGRVLSYGALAKALKLRGGARSAGRAMAATPSGKGIPWHRVVGDGGKILIREPYASLQKKLLESEGVKITESRVDLKAHLWKAAKPVGKEKSSRRRPHN